MKGDQLFLDVARVPLGLPLDGTMPLAARDCLAVPKGLAC